MKIEAVIWFCKYILAPLVAIVVSYYVGVYKERTFRKKNHDRKIFAKIEKILSDKELMDITLNHGYLLPNTFQKCDMLSAFITNPGNKFVDKETNNAFYNFQMSFFELNTLYSNSRYGDYVGDGNTFKLIANKRGDLQEEILLNEALTLEKENRGNLLLFSHAD